jgi:hypothetical protein
MGSEARAAIPETKDEESGQSLSQLLNQAEQEQRGE